jgi:site-specific DNA-cytosine methylase
LRRSFNKKIKLWEGPFKEPFFFNVVRIIAEKRPKAFLFENVKNLLSHDKRNTFKVIRDTLEKELGYHIQYKVMDDLSLEEGEV